MARWIGPGESLYAIGRRVGLARAGVKNEKPWIDWVSGIAATICSPAPLLACAIV